VPSTAVAVTTTYVSIVDQKTGAGAGISNADQLQVRGEVGTSDIVPTSSWSNDTRFDNQGHPINTTRFIWSAPAGQGLAVGELSVRGSNPDWPVVTLEYTYVAAGDACVSNFAGLHRWVGEAPLQSSRTMDFTFPVPFTVEPHANQRACLYAAVTGYNDFAAVSVVGAQGPSR
jgi:hypothetical protein